MFRYICTVFVALTACQAAFAGVVAERKIVELGLAEHTSPTIELLDTTLYCTSIGGDFIMGAHKTGETAYSLNYEDSNDKSSPLDLELHLSLPAGKKLAFMSATNRAGSNVAICSSPIYLQTSKVVVVLRFPAYSKAKVNFLLTGI